MDSRDWEGRREQRRRRRREDIRRLMRAISGWKRSIGLPHFNWRERAWKRSPYIKRKQVAFDEKTQLRGRSPEEKAAERQGVLDSRVFRVTGRMWLPPRMATVLRHLAARPGCQSRITLTQAWAEWSRVKTGLMLGLGVLVWGTCQVG